MKFLDEIISGLYIALIPVSAQPSADGFGLEDASGEQGTHVIVPVNITTVKNGPVQAIVFKTNVAITTLYFCRFYWYSILLLRQEEKGLIVCVIQ